MRIELPQLKRCCFCLPLRYGLLVWGYFKLIVDFPIIAISSNSLVEAVFNYYTQFDILIFRRMLINDMVCNSIVIFIFLTDFVLTTVFVYGGHKKNEKLLTMFFYYSQVIWVVSVVLITIFIGLIIEDESHTYKHNYINLRRYLATKLCFFFVNIVVQTYVLLLLRSEINKLKSNCDFRFVNNAADAECTMTCKDDVKNGEKGIEAA